MLRTSVHYLTYLPQALACSCSNETNTYNPQTPQDHELTNTPGTETQIKSVFSFLSVCQCCIEYLYESENIWLRIAHTLFRAKRETEEMGRVQVAI